MTEIRNIQDFSDFVDNLLSHSESDDLEYKSAAGGFPGSFWDTLFRLCQQRWRHYPVGSLGEKGRALSR